MCVKNVENAICEVGGVPKKIVMLAPRSFSTEKLL